MGHMIASLCAMGRDDASSGLLTAGSPEIVPPGRETPQNHRVNNHGWATISQPQKKHMDSCGGPNGADMCRSRETSSNVRMAHGFNIPRAPLGLDLFLQIQDSASWTFFQLLGDFPWQIPKDSHLGALLDALDDVDYLLSKASRSGSLLIRRQNMRIKTNPGPVIGAPVLPVLLGQPSLWLQLGLCISQPLFGAPTALLVLQHHR